jgi:hypothetical protein
MTAKDIQKLLEQKHIKDVYVPECKNGSTWFQNHLRLDGLAIARSWANPMVTGYEIKVSRSDFLQDDKFYGYLEYCNAFYFVCPSGLIMPTELPKEIGLYCISKTGTRLWKKKKAVIRDTEIPAELYKYILIARARIGRDIRYSHCEKNKEFWENWLKEKNIDRQFGYRVSRTIRERIENEIDEVRRENERLQSKMEKYEDVKQLLVKIGLKPEDQSTWSLLTDTRTKLDEARSGLPKNFEEDLSRCVKSLNILLERLCIKEDRG